MVKFTEDVTIWNEEGTFSVDVYSDNAGDGRIRTENRSKGQVDANNSSTATLAGDGVFTGTFTDTLEWTHITVLVRTDVASATDGLEIQWSSDGTNIDDTDNFTIPADNGKIFTFGPQSQYFRVKYTNGSTAQSEFRLQTILRPTNQKPSSHRITESIDNDDDATLVKAVLAGENTFSRGVFRNVKVDPQGKLEVAGAGTVLFEEVWIDDDIKTVEKWDQTLAGSGTQSVTNGVATFSVGTGSSDNSLLDSQQFFTFGLSNAIQLNIDACFPETGITGNNRMFGVSASDGHNNGYWFWLEDDTFYARSTFNGTDTNTDITEHFPTDGEFHLYRIRIFNGSRVEFYLDDVLIATHSQGANPLTGKKRLRMHLHNHNTATTSAGRDLLISTVSLSDEGQSAIQLLGASAGDSTVFRQVKVDSNGNLQTVPTVSADTFSQNKFASLAVGGTFPATVLTYTVPAGKRLLITNFHLQADNGDSLSTLKIDGTINGQYFSPSSQGLQQYTFGSESPIVVEAGEVVTIVAEVGSSSNKTYYGSFNGFEVDA